MKYYVSGVLKPDCIKRGLVEKIFNIFEKHQLKTVIKKELLLNENDVEVLYEEYRAEPFYPPFCQFMMSGKVIFYVLESDRKNTIVFLDKLVGPSNPVKAAPHTIRGMYGSNIRENVIHSTENKKTFLAEINRFLSKEEKSCFIKAG